MTLETDTAPETVTDNTPMTLEQSVAHSKARQAPPTQKESADDVEEQEASEDIADGEKNEELSDVDAQSTEEDDEAPEEDTLVGDEEGEEAQPETTLEPPSRWDANGKEVWGKLPVEAQEYVLKREKAQQAEVTKAQMNSADARKAYETRVKHLEEVSKTIGKYVEANQEQAQQYASALTDWENWFSSDDSVSMAQNQPAQYRQYEAQYRQLQAEATKFHKGMKQAEADKLQAENAARQEFLQEERQKLQSLVPELVDPEKGPARAQELASYLSEQGFPKDALTNLSAHEASISYKAMLYDRAQKHAAASQTRPKKRVKAGPSAPSAGRGAQLSSSEKEFKALSAKSNLTLQESSKLTQLRKKLKKK